MDKNKKIIVIVLLVIACLIAIIPLFALKGAEFGGSDEVESLLFCIQTGIGVGIMAFVMGRFVERKKWMTKKENK